MIPDGIELQIKPQLSELLECLCLWEMDYQSHYADWLQIKEIKTQISKAKETLNVLVCAFEGKVSTSQVVDSGSS